MHPRQAVPQTVIKLAEQQAGVLSRTQALGLGVTRKAIQRLRVEGQWGSLSTGIYLVPAVSPTWNAHVWAGILVGGDGSRAAGSTAAALLGLTDRQELPVQILVPNGTRPVRREWVTFTQERGSVRAPSGRAEPPRTRIEDTVFDLCAAGSETACVDWVTTAVQRRLTSTDDLLRALNRRPRFPHRQFLQSLLKEVSAGVHSPLEYRYLRDVERAHGLPAGVRQRLRPGRGGYIDVVYEEFALAVELDGHVGHIGSSETFRDRQRDNFHTSRGLWTLRFGWQDITADPCAVAAQVAEVLIGLGWGGFPTRCPRCR